jgi:SHS family lactate transporter-like MFS transporter
MYVSGTLQPMSPRLLAEARALTPDQRRAFFAAFLGWMLDGFDYTILTFVLEDIKHSFTIDNTLAGALGTVTLMFRLVGGAAAGTMADRTGRKLPLILSILWFSLFSVLTGFSTSYAMLFGFRALFGIGMGGEWAAGMPLALEHLPARLRGVAAGMLQGAFTWGYILSAFVFHFIYPLIPNNFAWRVMFWIGVLPALFVLWIRARVKESPVWLQRRREGGLERDGLSLGRIFRRDLLGTTIHASLVAAGFMVSYQSVIYWYPTLLRERHFDPLPFIVTLSVGGIVGSAFWGWVSQGRPGRRGAVTVASLIGIAMAPVYLMSEDPRLLLLGALLVGFGAHGMWGAFPSYISERFPAAVRGAGAGFCYHAGSLVGSVTPFAIGYMTVRGLPLPTAMTVAIAISGLAVASVIWLGPETRDRAL